MCKRKIILERNTEPAIKNTIRIGSGTERVGSTMVWAELNVVEGLSCAKAKTLA